MVIRRSWAVLLSLVLAAPLGTAASAQTLQLPSIVTIGLGFVVIPADHLVVTLNIETSDESAQAAYAASAAIVDAIREELQEADLAGLEIRTGRAHLWQQRSATRQTTTYRVTSTMSVTIEDEADVGRVVDTAMRLGATSVQSVRFQVRSLEEAARTALTLAVQDAMAKAEVISAATGTRIVNIRQVNDSNKIQVYNPSDPVLVESASGPDLPYPVTVERGQVLVQVEVAMEFEVAPRQQQ